MQSIVAFKTENKVTIITNGNITTDNYKISSRPKNIAVCGNGLVLVADGAVKEINVLDEMAYCLDKPLNELTKEYIMENVLPLVHDILEENGLLNFTTKGSLDIMFNLLVAYKDKLFYITDMFDIMEVSDYITLGQYRGPIFVKLEYINDEKVMVNRTLKVINSLKDYCFYLNDFVYIVDTQKQIIYKESVKDAISC